MTKSRHNHVRSGKEKFGLAFDLDFPTGGCSSDSCEERLRSLFDQLLVAFKREKSVSKCIRPIPVLSGDGRSVDLFKLFWVVRKIGGYNNISVNNLWGFVAEECGLASGEIPFVKLIYAKYLNELDQWLRQLNSERASSGNSQSRVFVTLDLLSWELETGFKVLMSVGGEGQERESKFVENIKDKEENITPDTTESEFHFSSVGRNIIEVGDTKCGSDDNSKNNNVETDFRLCVRRTPENVRSSGDVDGRSIADSRQFCTDDDDLAASAKRVVEKAVSEVNGFFTGEIDKNAGKFDDSDSNITSAKLVVEKVINKVHMCGEAIAADDLDENVSSQENSRVHISAKNVVETVFSKADEEERICAGKSIDILTPAKSDVKNVLDSRKRKREPESFSGMLKWLKDVAKHSDDPAVGTIPESSKWDQYGKEEFWVQTLLVRDALLVRRYAGSNSGERLQQEQQKKMKMQTSVLNHQSIERPRTSKRIPSLTKHTLCSCCNSQTTPPTKVEISQPDKEEGQKRKPPINPITSTETPPNPKDRNCTEMPVERQVRIGPSFQAEVPEWTGTISESDSKWLGTRMWDPEKNPFPEPDSVNEKRQICPCPFPNSVECVRFHIAEKRLELKRELGPIFYRWRFDRMGEEVSLSWTREEEKKFKDMMRLYAAFPNRFWNYRPRLFPKKTREKLVSYYFNVFLVQRRSYQNRVTPKDIDSDDDEKECGSIGDGFGYRALSIPGSESVSCSLNKECFDLL